MLRPKKLLVISPLFHKIANPRKRLLMEAKELFEAVYPAEHDIALVNEKYVHALISTGTFLLAKMKLCGSQVLLAKHLVHWADDLNLSIVLYVQVNRRFYFFDPCNLKAFAKDYKSNNQSFYKFTLLDTTHTIGVNT